MYNQILVFGLGVIGTEVISNIVKKNNNKNISIYNKKKNYKNIPGGIAYSKNSSRYGFFNNPLRLSNINFKLWFKNKENQIRLIEYINKSKNNHFKKWLTDNLNLKKNEFYDINNIYLPRITYSIYLQDKITEILTILKKKKILKLNSIKERL